MSESARSAAREGDTHFCCALSAVAVARVRHHGGPEAVAALLREAGSERELAFLEDIGNWIGFEEMIALWAAGARVTGNPDFARQCGVDAVHELGGSSISTVLRMLGSPEALLEKMSVAGRRFSVCTDTEPISVEPGRAEIRATAAPGFRRDPLHCAWAQGMYTTGPVLFGLPAATVEHPVCQARGDAECRYLITWDAAGTAADSAGEAARLRSQLRAMTERLEQVFATASDLISSAGIEETLQRITQRAAHQVRAPAHLLAVRPSPGRPPLTFQRGLSEADAGDAAARLLGDAAALPANWLVAEVRSSRNHYGRLAAIFGSGEEFLPAERQLLEVYARYAASALDSAGALREAQRQQDAAEARYRETRALLELARALASAEDSGAVARRLARAVPNVIDCDRAAVYLWDVEARELVRTGLHAKVPSPVGEELVRLRAAELPELAALAAHPDPEPVFIDVATSPLHGALIDVGAVGTVGVPIVGPDGLLGCVVVSVLSGPERLAPSAELRDRLSGVAAHAVPALQNGRLVDRITHQASHDQLTGLVNRAGFGVRYEEAAARADATVALFYVDLDRFKAVNDEFGHDVGDGLLRAVAARVRGLLRPHDTVARIGGDEFLVLVENEVGSDPGALDAVAARIDAAFRLPFRVGRHELRLGASVGRAVYPDDVTNHTELLRRADEAMYARKRARQETEPAA